MATTKSPTRKPTRKTPAKTAKKTAGKSNSRTTSASTANRKNPAVSSKSVKPVSAQASAGQGGLSRRFGLWGLQIFNYAAGILLLVQMAVLLLASSSSRGIKQLVSNYPVTDPLQSTAAGYPVYATGSHHLTDINLLYAVTAFLLISAAAFLLSASLFRKHYLADIAERRNRLRWLNLGLGGGLALCVIAVLNGINDVASLLSLFAIFLTAAMLGYVMELYYEKFRMPRWVILVLSAAVAIVPWLVLASYVRGALIYGNGLPGYLYWLDASSAVLFAAAVVNFYLARRQRGRWADYEFAERLYILLGFIAATAITWQLYVGTLRR